MIDAGEQIAFVTGDYGPGSVRAEALGGAVVVVGTEFRSPKTRSKKPR
jgi:hypothetical protein